MSHSGPCEARVPRGQLFAYSAAELPMSVVATPVSLFLPAFYTQDLGLGMATVGFVLMLAKFWDVATDPVIGYLSDRTRTRISQRKPWVLACCGLAGPCSTSRTSRGAPNFRPTTWTVHGSPDGVPSQVWWAR